MSDELVTEFNFELTMPFDYALKGETESATFISLKAPTSKNMKECAYLKQAFFRALPKENNNQGNDEDKEKGQITGDEIMTLILMSDTVDLINVLLHARELFTSGVALVDGETKMTKLLFDSMSQDDIENMTGEYLANFTLASSLAKLNEQ